MSTCCAYWPGDDDPGPDFCTGCGLEGACTCDAMNPRIGPRESDLERARRSRLTLAEIETLGISTLDLNGGIWW